MVWVREQTIPTYYTHTYNKIPLKSENWVWLTAALISIFQDYEFPFDNQSTGRSAFIIKE
jgi:hypothetical protein